jgi:hypothetical protein
MDQKNSSNVSSGGTATVEQIRSYDWDTTNPQQFLSQFRTIVERAGRAGVPQQQLLDEIANHYRSGQSGSGGSTSGGSQSNR